MRRVFLIAALLAVLVGAAAWAYGPSEKATRQDRFDSPAAWAFLKRQVALGPRPAASPKSRDLAEMLRRSIPNGRFQAVPGGLRNVVGTIPGRNPRRKVVLGAHYDTKDLAGFVGANDGASGTAVVRQLARAIKPLVVAADGDHRLLRRRGGAARQGLTVRAVRAAREQGRRAHFPIGGVSDRPRLRGRQGARNPARSVLEPPALGKAAGGVAAHRLHAPFPGPVSRAPCWTTTCPSSARACR